MSTKSGLTPPVAVVSLVARGVEMDIAQDSKDLTLLTDFLQALDPFLVSIIDSPPK